MAPTVTALHIYPVKSCRGISLESATISKTGTTTRSPADPSQAIDPSYKMLMLSLHFLNPYELRPLIPVFGQHECMSQMI